MHRMHAQVCRLCLTMIRRWIGCGVGAMAAFAWCGQPSEACGPICHSSAPAETNSTAGDVHLPAATAPSAAPVPADDLDPLEVFNKVVDRYHRLLTYRDSVWLVQTTQRQGETVSSAETSLSCEIAHGKLHIQTAGSALRGSLGIDLPITKSPALEKARLRYDLWLAPHMAMKFAKQPLKDFRAGIDEGFTATDAQAVTIDNKKMVHLALKSGDGLSEDCAAKFDLFINPESMLIERIDGEQRLPDGANYQTTLHITPLNAESQEAELQPAT